jgi:hypothetical protein
MTCDICPETATVVRPATRHREEARYCRYDAGRYLGWQDTYHKIEPGESQEGTGVNILSEDEARRELKQHWGLAPDIASNVLRIAREFRVTAEPVDGGYVTVTLVNNNSFTIERGKKEGAESRQSVARRTAAPYTRAATKPRPAVSRSARTTTPAQGRTKAMATKAAEPEVEETEDAAPDYTGYATKQPTATMTDFADWLLEEGAVAEDAVKNEALEHAFREGVRLGGTLRMEFQRSDFNVTRREERKAAREAAAAAEPEEEEAPAKAPARGGRGKATAAKPATTAAKPAAAKAPARGRRGKAAATAAAPY